MPSTAVMQPVCTFIEDAAAPITEAEGAAALGPIAAPVVEAAGAVLAPAAVVVAGVVAVALVELNAETSMGVHVWSALPKLKYDSEPLPVTCSRPEVDAPYLAVESEDEGPG